MKGSPFSQVKIFLSGYPHSMEAVSCHEIALMAKTASVLRKAGRFRPPCHGGLASVGVAAGRFGSFFQAELFAKR